MKGVAAIEVDKDRTFLSLASLKKGIFSFWKEIEMETDFEEDFLGFFKKNWERIEEKISEEEKKNYLKIEKIFVALPWYLERKRIVEDIIPLRKKKRIKSYDISISKKQLENIFLDWNDLCVHHIVLGYGIEDKVFRNPPIGIETKNLKLKSLLIWVKEQLYREIENIFINRGREFAGFISSWISNLSLFLEEKKEGKIGILKIDYEKSYFVIFDEGNFSIYDFEFGLKKVFQKIQDEFLFSFDLAKEVFLNFFSFKEIFPFKEVSIKNKNTYINLSLKTLNSLVKNYIKEEILKILREVKKEGDFFSLYFVGRLNKKEGFSNFIKNMFPYVGKIHFFKSSVPSSLGCLKYGVFKSLENDCVRKRESFLQKILSIYKEYF